jgi:hypothetical protein
VPGKYLMEKEENQVEYYNKTMAHLTYRVKEYLLYKISAGFNSQTALRAYNPALICWVEKGIQISAGSSAH